MKRQNKRLFVLSLDGVPYSLVQEAFQKGRMPHFQHLSRQGSLARMNSTIPVISSVAWATFSTGVNPAQHGIFGFVDRDRQLHPVVLTALHLQAKSLWRRLNECGKRVIAINVPGTYPPQPLQGIVVADFLSPSIEKAVYPSSLVPLLYELGYVIDPEPQLAFTDKSAFLDDIFWALKARSELAFRWMEREEWDFFMLHVMETDRLHHFFWDAKDNVEHEHHGAFWELYSQLDGLIARVADTLDSNAELMILSDHGFCEIRQEVNLNSYLTEQGFLRFNEGAQELLGLDPSSRAYSLTPGRIYVNLRGRETRGSVDTRDVPRLLRELTDALYELKDPQTGEPVIQKIYTRDEIYRGPLLSQAPELIAHPANGYDLKSGRPRSSLFSRSPRTGMHTYPEALVYVRGYSLATGAQTSILDVTPTLFELMGLNIPSELEGKSLLLASSRPMP